MPEPIRVTSNPWAGQRTTADPILTSHALRGVRIRCRYGWHKMRLMTRSKDPAGTYRTVTRCQKCGLVRHEEGRV